MKSLIPMTDFVLQIINQDNLYSDVKMLLKISNYANFLKHPLELGMIVPADEQGNVLNNPRATDIDAGTEKELQQTIYNNALKRVMFEGFTFIGDSEASWIFEYKKGFTLMIPRKTTVEYLCFHRKHFRLTQTAIELFYL